MKFKKQLNGNIIITDDSDVNLKLLQNIPTTLDVLDDNKTIEIRQNGILKYQFLASEVTAYQVLPAAEVAFASDADAFIGILSDYFFNLNNGELQYVAYSQTTSTTSTGATLLTRETITAFLNEGLYEIRTDNIMRASGLTSALELNLYVDEVLVNQSTLSLGLGFKEAVNLSYIVALTTGSHTIKTDFRRTVAATTANIDYSNLIIKKIS